MQLSVIVPLLNEAESLPQLYQWIDKTLSDFGVSYEVLFIDDGSTDDSWKIIKQITEQNPKFKGLRFQKNYGKSQALHAGFKLAEGEIVFTMDADLQDSPEEIPEMYSIMQDQQLDLLSGWKKKRYDAYLSKNLPSKLFNWAARKTSGLKLHDFNCGLKAYRNTVIKNIKVQGEMHRYIPVLAKNAGFTKIDEKPVQHQARKFGETKFGYERFLHGFLDLITLWFMSKFGKRPMHFFGSIGLLMFSIGFISAAGIGISKLYKLYTNAATILVTDNPWFYIALTTMIIGSLFFLAGFIGELILKYGHKTPTYRIAESLGIEKNELQKNLL